MAGETNGAIALKDTEHIPIAQLSPSLTTPATRAIKAVVTLTWPYSSATGSVAFLLSEPDFRLRRTRGQVRVRFSGSSAKAVAASGIASGDEVVLSLDGVEWVSDDATIVTPGRGVEFELRYTERLLLEFKQEGSEEVKNVDLDHPPPEEPAAAPAQIPTPEPEETLLPTSTPMVKRTAVGIIHGDEFSSPAFIKRARTSYGSLFESEDDIFAEDGSIPGKGRKKTRLSSSWRYASRSPSPEAEELEVESMDTSETMPEPAPKPTPMMADEGCQTVDFGDHDSTEDMAQVLADLSRQAVNVGKTAYPVLNGSAFLGPQQTTGKFLTGSTDTAGLPTIRTEMLAQEHEVPEVEPPKSPRLQPVPSDSLSLVSPLLSMKHGILSHPNGELSSNKAGHLFSDPDNSREDPFPPEQVNHQQTPQDKIHADGDTLDNTIGEEEDIYSASPAGRREQDLETGFSGFPEQNITNDGMDIPIFDNQFISENQYGQWQSAGAHLSNTASPRNGNLVEGSHEGRFLDSIGEDNENEELGVGVEMPHSEYPEMEDGLLGQITSAWGASSVTYPELPDLGVQADPYTHQTPQSTGMSRSQSGQSPVVDLTESDGEAHSQAGLQRSGGEYEDFIGGDSGEGALEPPEGQSIDHSDDGNFKEDDFDSVQTSAIPNDQYDDEDAEADGEEEGDYEEDAEEVYTKIPSAFESDEEGDEQMEDYDQDEEGSFDEEERSYDEEESEDEQLPQPKVRSQPEVIDLLSSDDEDEAPAKAAVSAVNSHRSSPDKEVNYPQIPEDDSENSNGESELDENEHLPLAELSEIKTSLPGPQPDYSSGEEDEAEDDDEMPTNTVLQHGGTDSENEDSENPDQDSDSQRGDSEDDDVVSEEPVSEVPQEILARVTEAIGDLDSELGPQKDEIANGTDYISLPPEELELGGMEVESPSRLVARNPSPLRKSPERPSLFNSVFGLDGAHDEPRFGTSYRSMSRDEGTLPTSALLQKVFSAAPIEALSKEGNLQLPTPEDTQVSRMTVSIENSFSSAKDSHTPSHVVPDEKDAERVDESQDVQDSAEVGSPISEVMSSPVTRIQTFSETVTVTLEVSEDTDMRDVDGHEVETYTEEVTETSDVVRASEKSPMKEVSEIEGSLEPPEEYQLMADDEPVSDDEPVIDDESVEEDEPIEEDGPIESEPMEEHEKLYSSEPEEETIVLTPTVVTAESQLGIGPRSLRSHDSDGHPPSRPQSSPVPENTDEPEIHTESPRRSTRRTNASLKAVETMRENIRPVTPNKASTASTKEKPKPASSSKVDAAPTIPAENTQPVTPVKPRGVAQATSSDNEESPLLVFKNQDTPKGHDASIEFALEASDASSPAQHNLRKPPVADFKLRLKRALRTELSEFTALKVLRYQLTKKLDFLAVATTTPPEPQRAKNGPRQYQITFNITDPSIAPSGVTEVQVFRPYKDALPIIKAGDGILLRNFLVMSVQQSRTGGPAFALRSTQEDASSWAVFKDDEEVEIRGPPVEYGDAEKNHVMQLKTWYAELDSVAMAKIARANGDKSAAGSAAGKKKK
ncbi:hypothetical protein VTL71DRAFT_5692 [Oculimacula yallundae]|uniref:Telomeric single stranded DNA binding POT1/Cdc13 domain-containing protein n=1 Tax=Oculimacula yallundae TaxID=86028 RepID=A0ABR4BY97_9HELO